MGTALFLLLLWYIIYRLSKNEYKRRTGRELHFLDTLNPKNWKDM